MRIFGIDPGSERTGYGCIESSGGRHRLVTCGSLSAPARSTFPERLLLIHSGLQALLQRHRPACVAIENIFFAKNVRSALKLGHARGVALLAASQASIPVVEYSPAEIKRSVVGYGRAEKQQVQGMMKLLLGLDKVPSPHDAADALAVAVCHLHSIPAARIRDQGPGIGDRVSARSGGGTPIPDPRSPKTWRQYRPPAG